MNVTRPIIEHCVDVELEAARKEHEDFHSLHEAYAVTLEEVYEAQDEYNAMGALTETLWSNVRADDPESFYKNMAEVEKHAINLAAEAVQVAAMARKARRLGKGENKTWFEKE